jgi:hypothetical protein
MQPRRRRKAAARSIGEKMLDCLAQILSSRVAIFGLRAPNPRYLRITPAQLARGRFAGGAARFVIDGEGVRYSDLRVSLRAHHRGSHA